MSRFSSEPVPGYDPLLRVSLREQPEGGATRAMALARWRGGQPAVQHELLLLIHGFNNHEREASEAYLGWRQRQERMLPDELAAPLEALLGDAFWPGDAAWSGAIDKLDFLAYPEAVSVARDLAAPRLGDYLRDRSDVLTLHLLGHSLGCRVALELIEDLRSRGGPAIGKVCLMAAAVPIAKLGAGGSLQRAMAAPEQMKVLYSPNDLVLSGAFPPGQTLASGDEGFFPTALGLNGDVPSGAGAMQRELVVGAGHGDYWGHTGATPNEQAARAIRDFFAFAQLPARALAAHAAAPTRRLPSRRTVAG